MILQFVVKAFEEESSLHLPEVYDRYKLLLNKNDLNIVIDANFSSAASDLEKKLKEL
jgi:hypothetical protein